MARDEGQQVLVVFGVGRITLVALDNHGADRSAFRAQWHAEPVDASHPDVIELTSFDEFIYLALREQQRGALP